MSNELERIARALERIADAVERSGMKAIPPQQNGRLYDRLSRRIARDNGIRAAMAFVHRAPKPVPDGLNPEGMARWFVSAFGLDADPSDINLWWKLCELRTVQNLGDIRRKRMHRWMLDCFGEVPA